MPLPDAGRTTLYDLIHSLQDDTLYVFCYHATDVDSDIWSFLHVHSAEHPTGTLYRPETTNVGTRLLVEN